MYEDFSADYDRFVDWPSRLAMELPFIERQLQAVKEGDHPVRVLDAACGTGMHAIALAQRGHVAAGADLSAAMIERARQNAAVVGARHRRAPTFEATGFGTLAQIFGSHSFDALLCLGNSLPHLLNEADLARALADFAATLRPGGLLLIQQRNFDAVLSRKERWMEPNSHREGDSEWLFLRFYDFEPDGLIAFHVVTLHRQGAEPWRQKEAVTMLRPIPKEELAVALSTAGFSRIKYYGDMTGAAFDPQISGNLVVTAQAGSA